MYLPVRDVTIRGQPAGCVPPAVFLYGHPSTGKTTALKAVLTEFGGPRAVVGCVECYTPLLLYQLVLRQLTGE